MNKSGRKALWAVDVFAKKTKTQIHVVHGLEKLVRGTDIWIEPVCVLSPDQLRIPAKAFAGHHKEYRLEAEQRLEKICKESKIKGLLAPTLLVQENLSLRSSVDALVQYAKDTSAEIIATGTTTKSALTRFLIGSYAESLILRSTVPVYIVSPKAKVQKNISKVLFPTDYSEKSYTAYLKFLPTVRVRKAQVLLYYKMEYVVPVVYGFDPLPVYDNFWEQELKAKKEASRRWLQSAKDAGVKVKTIFDEKSGYVLESILSTAKKNACGIIALASESGAGASAFLGSVTRQTVRHATCPVWVIHP